MLLPTEQDFIRLQTAWIGRDLRAVGQNRRLAMLIAKAERADRVWAWIDGLVTRFLRREWGS